MHKLREASAQYLPAMAIRHTRTPFGPYTLHQVGSGDTYVSFVPERSGYVHQVCLAGRELLWNYPDGDALTANKGHRNLALFPFPNRLLEGQYTWAGEEHAFEVNKPDTRSALHGFGPHTVLQLARVDLETDRALVTLSYVHRADDHPQSYPFDVRCDLELGIDVGQQEASWTLKATNLSGGAVPVGLGWHPYFLLPGGHEQWSLRMPPNEHVELEQAIPTGRLLPGLSAKPVAIDTDWDDCFKLSDANNRTVLLQGPAYGLRLTQTGTTRYTQLYVPPGAGSVAVEPMSCGVNAFQEAQEEVSIEPGNTLQCGMRIALA